jgi:hypothetical protein
MTTPKPGLAQRGKERMAGRAAAVIAPALEPGERILIGARVQSGISQWWVLLSAYARLFQRWYYLVLTDRRLIFCGISFWTGRPTAIKIVTPREQARVTDFRPGAVWTSFRVGFPGRDKPLRIRAPRVYRPEVESMLSALGAGDPAAAGGLGPSYGTPPGALPDGTELGGPAPR